MRSTKKHASLAALLAAVLLLAMFCGCASKSSDASPVPPGTSQSASASQRPSKGNEGSAIPPFGQESDSSEAEGHREPAMSERPAGDEVRPAPETAPEEAPRADDEAPQEQEAMRPEPEEPEPEETEPIITEPPRTEPAQTEPAPTEPPKPEAEDLTKNYSREDWKKINTFLSNFSEVYFGDYERDDTGNEYELLQYGYLHLKINSPSKVKYTNGYYKVTKTEMDKCLNRFFGHTVPTGEYWYIDEDYGYQDLISYRNDGAYFTAGEGEAYNYLSVVYRVEATDRGTYLAYFDVYELDIEEYFDQGMSSKYYSMTHSEAENASNLLKWYSGVAEVKDYDGGSFKSYQLLSYHID